MKMQTAAKANNQQKAARRWGSWSPCANQLWHACTHATVEGGGGGQHAPPQLSLATHANKYTYTYTYTYTHNQHPAHKRTSTRTLQQVGAEARDNPVPQHPSTPCARKSHR